MSEVSQARQSLRKKLKPIEREMKRVDTRIAQAQSILAKLEQEKQSLVQSATQLKSALRQLKPDDQTTTPASRLSTRPAQGKKGVHAVALALVEPGSKLRRSDLEKLVTRELAKEAGFKPSSLKLRLKDVLRPGEVLNALRSKMSRPREDLELKLIGRARIAREPDANRRLAATVDTVGKMMSTQPKQAPQLTTKQVKQQLNLSLKNTSGMNL